MSYANQEMIHVVAPALRVLLAEGHAWKRIRFDPEEVTGDDILHIRLPEGLTETAEVVKRLRDAVASPCSGLVAVSVEGLGAFAVSDPVMTGRVAGKVAFVTGAAQGFGREIAEHLAGEGAIVVLADINTSGALDAAEGICKEHGPERALGLSVDVTDGHSVQRALDETVRRFGGLDLLISNAGTLRAGSVKTQPEEAFDAVTAVNYRGYFICVQKAAPILAVGHIARPDYTSDIIQINSKSGLVGSSRNGAYAGSKFGAIGLTQSFALELIQDGVKVNAICPGNFFDGPLWSDPENGLFVQYLRAGKVPGARTVQDVRKAYEAKAPIGRGCCTLDVMRAIYYAVEQQYETGQAIPVTGGQVMLS